MRMAIFTAGCGETIKLRGMERCSFVMVLVIRENGPKTNNMVKDDKSTQVATYTKETSPTVKNMGKAKLLTQMEAYTRVTS